MKKAKKSNKKSSKTKKSKRNLKIVLFLAVVMLVCGLIALAMIPTKQISCPTQSSYNIQVPSDVQEPYERYYSYSITSDECSMTLRGLFDVGASHRIFVVNNEEKGGTFEVTSIIRTNQRGEIRQTSSKYISPKSYGEFNFDTDVDYDETGSCHTIVDPPKKTLYSTKTKYRQETRYETIYVWKKVNWIFGKC